MQAIINNLINISILAGRRILEIYNSDFSFEIKSDNSPLTIADRESHRIITEGLKWCYPDIPLMSEEGIDVSYDTRRGWKNYFLIDPLDGTKEFIKRNGEFTINLALMEKDAPIAGLIFIPVKRTIYYAMKDHGSYKLCLDNIEKTVISDGVMEKLSTRLPIYKRNGARDSIIVAGSRSHKSERMDAFLQSLRNRYREIKFIPAGSSLKFCLIAEGLADIYPRFGTTMEWDTAAGQIVVEESGGQVLDLETHEPLKYNKKDMKNPWFIAINDFEKRDNRII